MKNIDIDQILIEFFGEDYHEKVNAKNVSRLKDNVEKLTIENNLHDHVPDGLIFFNCYSAPSQSDNIHISDLSRAIHAHNVNAGWWSDIRTGDRIRRNKHELLGLIASEIFEAFDGARKDLDDSHLPHHKAICVEMADAIIRIFDYAGKFNINPFYIMEDRLTKECIVTLTNYPDAYKEKAEILNNYGYCVSVESLYQLDLMKNFVSNKTSLHSSDSDGNIFSQMFRISSLLGLLSFVELNNGENKSIENIIISSAFLMMLDFCNRHNLDVVSAITDKLIYNKTRQDHKKENRLKDGGKMI